MANYTAAAAAAIFLGVLLHASFSPANSAATCPINVALRLDPCSVLANRIAQGGGTKGLPAPQCCRALTGLNGQQAADCLCVVLKGSFSGNIDAVLGNILHICEMSKPEGYICVV